jgi:hypothetical protein
MHTVQCDEGRVMRDEVEGLLERGWRQAGGFMSEPKDRQCGPILVSTLVRRLLE